MIEGFKSVFVSVTGLALERTILLEQFFNLALSVVAKPKLMEQTFAQLQSWLEKKHLLDCKTHLTFCLTSVQFFTKLR